MSLLDLQDYGILADVAAEAGVSLAEMRKNRGPGRSYPQGVVKANRMAARRLRAVGRSLPHIGRLLKRHHSTVMSMVRPKP